MLVLWLAGVSACSLDFDALERGRGGDGGPAMDASIDAARMDAAPRDDGIGPIDAPPVDIDAPGCRRIGSDPDCGDPACEGVLCNDALNCTTGDRCSAGVCAGAPLVCPTPDPCQVQRCDEATGVCAFAGAMPDTTPCGGTSRCCFGRCSNLRDSANCGGCGLACDEETCTPESEPPRCICAAVCPAGQTCQSGRCVCTTSAQCGSATCRVDMGAGYCSY